MPLSTSDDSPWRLKDHVKSFPVTLKFNRQLGSAAAR